MRRLRMAKSELSQVTEASRRINTSYLMYINQAVELAEDFSQFVDGLTFENNEKAELTSENTTQFSGEKIENIFSEPEKNNNNDLILVTENKNLELKPETTSEIIKNLAEPTDQLLAKKSESINEELDLGKKSKIAINKSNLVRSVSVYSVEKPKENEKSKKSLFDFCSSKK